MGIEPTVQIQSVFELPIGNTDFSIKQNQILVRGTVINMNTGESIKDNF